MSSIISVAFTFHYYDDDCVNFCPEINFDFYSASFSIKAKAYGTDKCEFIRDESNPTCFYLDKFSLNSIFTDQGDDSEWGMGYQPIVDIAYTIKVTDYLTELNEGIHSFNEKYGDKNYLYINNDKIWLETDPDKIKELTKI